MLESVEENELPSSSKRLQNLAKTRWSIKCSTKCKIVRFLIILYYINERMKWKRYFFTESFQTKSSIKLETILNILDK